MLTDLVKRLTHPLTTAMAKNGGTLSLFEKCANTDASANAVASESERGSGLAVRVDSSHRRLNNNVRASRRQKMLSL